MVLVHIVSLLATTMLQLFTYVPWLDPDNLITLLSFSHNTNISGLEYKYTGILIQVPKWYQSWVEYFPLCN